MFFAVFWGLSLTRSFLSHELVMPAGSNAVPFTFVMVFGSKEELHPSLPVLNQQKGFVTVVVLFILFG